MKSVIESSGKEFIAEYFYYPDKNGRDFVFVDEEKVLAAHHIVVREVYFYHQVSDESFIKVVLPAHVFSDIAREIERLRTIPVEPMEIDY